MADYEVTMRGERVVLRPPTHAFQQDEAPTLTRRITEALERSHVVLDLSEVEAHGDVSAGLRALVVGVRSALSKGRRLLLAAPSAYLTEKLIIARMNFLIPPSPSVEDAIAADETAAIGTIIGGEMAWERCRALHRP